MLFYTSFFLLQYILVLNALYPQACQSKKKEILQVMSFSIQRTVLKYDKQMATFLENLETTSLTFQRSVGGWSKLTLVYLVSSRGQRLHLQNRCVMQNISFQCSGLNVVSLLPHSEK